MNASPSLSFYRRLRRAVRLTIDLIPVLNKMVLTSAGYRRLTLSQARASIEKARTSSWSAAANRQELIYAQLLAQMYAGQPRLDFRIASDAVIATGIDNPTLLEVGCGNGYYSEILTHLIPGGVRYTGLDYSPEMIASARSRYQGVTFVEGDTTRMTFASGSFDIVMDGVSLMHILSYRQAIAEIARVARNFVIFNCLPVFQFGETVYLSKFAYGQPVVEIIFGRDELESALVESGLTIVDAIPSIPYDVHHVVKRHSTFMTLICKKVYQT